MPRSLLATSVPLLLSVLAATSAAQTGGAPAPGSREAMWPAPTAEDWAKPCLIRWQRSFEDAIATARATGKPILICVNMDGEPASEHYAGIRYREPAITKLYEPYVCVIASVYRHAERDYDENGERIPCPRFGIVTCGEHIAIEPLLFDQFFEDTRVAPRHIMIELDKRETYDVYYAYDTDSVFRAIREGIENRELKPLPPPSTDRTLLQRVDSRDSADQEAVEQAFAEGDAATRRALLEAALEAGDDAPVDMLRLAVFGLDVEQSRMARKVLARSSSARSIDVIAEALRVPMEAAEREALIAALERIGGEEPRARTLAAVHRGLNSRSSAFDVDDWSRALAGAPRAAPGAGRELLQARLAYQDERRADPVAKLDLAESLLARAFDPSQAGLGTRRDAEYLELVLADAYRYALEAQELGAEGWRLEAVVALATYYQDDLEVAAAHAEDAVAAMPAGEPSWTAMAVLELFAKSRWGAIVDALKAKEEWPRDWLTDVNSACSVLAGHPLGTDGQVAWHHDILDYLKAKGEAREVLEAGLTRFPDSWQLHQRLRRNVLSERGVDGLEEEYARRLEARPTANMEWYAGYAALVTAEFHRRRGRVAAADGAYVRAAEHYDRCAQAAPELQDNTDHYVALTLAGRARLMLEAEDYRAAASMLLASFERCEDAAATLDGLGLSAVATARTLIARLREGEQAELAGTLEAVLDGLDPVLLEPPVFEPRGPAGRPSPDARRFRREGQERR